jgi:hypothetical protein
VINAATLRPLSFMFYRTRLSIRLAVSTFLVVDIDTHRLVLSCGLSTIAYG